MVKRGHRGSGARGFGRPPLKTTDTYLIYIFHMAILFINYDRFTFRDTYLCNNQCDLSIKPTLLMARIAATSGIEND